MQNMAFTLAFTGSATVTEECDYAALTNPINLPVGTYSLTVTAYMDTDTTRTTPIARGQESNIGITHGGITSRTVTLTMITDSDVDGNFEWDITFSSTNVASANMLVTKFTLDGSTPPDPVVLEVEDLLGKASGDEDLPVGFYNVLITLKWSGGQETFWYSILHIYPGMKSVLKELDFTDAHFINIIHTVTFDYGDSVTAKQSVLHNEKVVEPAAPYRDGWFFGGWYTEADFTNQFDFINTPITDDTTTLYAKWFASNSSGEWNVLVHHLEGDNAYTPYADLASALTAIKNDGEGTYTVQIAADQTLDGHTNSGAGYLNTTGVRITLVGAGTDPVEIQLNNPGRMFTVSGAASLTLGNNITLVGHSANDNNLVRVENGGSFTMLEGSKVTGNTSNASRPDQSYRYLGSAVYVNGSSSTFTMEGGSISGNSAIEIGVNPFATCGLYIESNPTVNLQGGSISGNQGDNDIYAASGTASLTLSGNVNIGTILMAAIPAQQASITIENGWSGSIEYIHLISSGIWKDQQVLQGAGGMGLNTAAVGRVGLGNFIDDTDSTNNNFITTPISATHKISENGWLVEQ